MRSASGIAKATLRSRPHRLAIYCRPPGRVTSSDPPLAPGMLTIEMDSRGRVRYFAAMPRFQPAPSHPDWKTLFDRAGLDLSHFTETPAGRLPPVPGDSLLQWTGRVSPNDPEQMVAAASWRGQPVYFERLDPQSPLNQFPPRLRIVPSVIVVLLSAVAVRLVFLAWRNLQQQRGDRRGAFRVGAAVFWVSFAEWLLVARHSLSPHEVILAAYALSWALLLGALAWVGYVAVDPLARRLYPHLLISLQQVLTGAPRDNLLGRDVLWGLTLAAWGNFLSMALTLGVSEKFGEKIYVSSGLNLRDLAGLWLSDLRIGIWVGLLVLAFIIPLRARFERRLRVGVVAAIVAETGLFCLKDLPTRAGCLGVVCASAADRLRRARRGCHIRRAALRSPA